MQCMGRRANYRPFSGRKEMNPTLIDLKNNLFKIEKLRKHGKSELEILSPEYQSMEGWVNYWIKYEVPELEEKDRRMIEAFKNQIAHVKLKHFRTDVSDHVIYFLDDLKHSEVPRAELVLITFLKWFEVMVFEDQGYYSDRHPF